MIFFADRKILYFRGKFSMMKKLVTTNGIVFLILLVAALILMSGCANNEAVHECLTGRTYGFWYGLWHGIIAPVDLVLMIWRDDITVYAPNNNGVWYAFGFLLGSGGWGLLGGSKACGKRKG
jgi:hypothetical protein